MFRLKPDEIMSEDSIGEEGGFIAFLKILGRFFRILFFLVLAFYGYSRLAVGVTGFSKEVLNFENLFFFLLLIFSIVGIIKPYGSWGNPNYHYYDSESLYLVWGIVGSFP